MSSPIEFVFCILRWHWKEYINHHSFRFSFFFFFQVGNTVLDEFGFQYYQYSIYKQCDWGFLVRFVQRPLLRTSNLRVMWRGIQKKRILNVPFVAHFTFLITTLSLTLASFMKRSVHLGVMYPCQKCDYKASLSMNLKRHIRSKHEGKIFQCSICKAEYTDQGNLRRHQKVSHEGRRFKCDECESTYSGSAELSRHARIKHKNITYPCQNCDYRAPEKHKLTTHMRELHENPKVLQCEKCDYNSFKKNNLRSHMHSKHRLRN